MLCQIIGTSAIGLKKMWGIFNWRPFNYIISFHADYYVALSGDRLGSGVPHCGEQGGISLS